MWFSITKTEFDTRPSVKNPSFFHCDHCGYYNIAKRSSKSKTNLEIHRKYTKVEITNLCIQLKLTAPFNFFSEDPDSDDSGCEMN